MATSEESRVRDTFLRTIAVVGLVAVLLLGAWGIIQLAVALPSLFGSVGSGVTGSLTNGQESIMLSAPATAAANQPLTLSWNHQNASGAYSYAISYTCQSGLSLKAPLPTGAYETIQCNTPFNFVNASSSMTVIPTLTGSQQTLTVTVSATKLSTGAITATGSANVMIQSASANQTSTNTNTSTGSSQTSQTQTSGSNGASSTYYPAATRVALYGYPDLAVTILSVTPSSNYSGSLTNVEFEIQNVGTNIVTGGWNFDAVLPIDGGYTFQSQPQQALYPGDKIVYTLSYANSQYEYSNGSSGEYYTGGGYTCNYSGPCDIPGYQSGSYNYNYNSNGYGYSNGTIIITADPYNQVVELSKANNTASISAPTY